MILGHGKLPPETSHVSPQYYGMRTLSYAYRQAGFEIEPGIEAVRRIPPLGGSAGITATRTSNTQTGLIGASHLGDMAVGSLSGAHSDWSRELGNGDVFHDPTGCGDSAILRVACSTAQSSGVAEKARAADARGSH